MHGFTRMLVGCLTLLPASGLAAADDPMTRLLGTWVSPDGQSRQRVERNFDGSWLTTRQWFSRNGDWVLVGRGAMYPKPGTSVWVGATRTAEMGGIVLFESVIQPGDDLYSVENRAYMEDGSLLETVEEWRFPDADRIDYEVYRVTNGGREAWLEGSWLRTSAWSSTVP